MNATVRAFLHHSLGPVAYQYDGLTPEEQALCTLEEFREMVFELSTYSSWFVVEVRKDGRWEAYDVRQRGSQTFAGGWVPGDHDAVATGLLLPLSEVRLRLATPAEEAAIEAGQV